jgi:hypothetical protein
VASCFQYFAPANVQAELLSTDFAVRMMSGGLEGEPLESGSDTIGVIAGLANQG